MSVQPWIQLILSIRGFNFPKYNVLYAHYYVIWKESIKFSSWENSIFNFWNIYISSSDMYSIFSPHLSIYGCIYRYELYIIWISQQTFQKGIIILWHRLCEVTMLIFETMSLLSWSLSGFCLFNLFVSMCMHVRVDACMCVHAYMHTCVCVHACTRVCAFVYVCAYVGVCMCVSACLRPYRSRSRC